MATDYASRLPARRTISSLVKPDTTATMKHIPYDLKNIDFFHEYKQMSKPPSQKQPSMVSRSTQVTVAADKCEQGTMTTRMIEHGRPIANKCTNTSNERVVVRCTKCLKRYRSDEIYHSNRCHESTSQLDLIGRRLTDPAINDRPNSVISQQWLRNATIAIDRSRTRQFSNWKYSHAGTRYIHNASNRSWQRMRSKPELTCSK